MAHRFFSPVLLTRRMLVILIFGGLVLGSAWFWRHFFLDLDPGHGPAGPAVAEESFHHVWCEQPVVLLGLGDSVTAGYGSSRGHSFVDLLVAPPHDDWPDMQGRQLQAVFPHLTTMNKGICNTTSFDVVEHELVRMSPFPAQTRGIAIVSTGGNDLIHNYGTTAPNPQALFGASWTQAQPWIAAFTGRLDAIVARCQELFPGGVEVFLLTIFDPTDGVGDIDAAQLPAWPDGLAILTAYNDTIRSCTERHAHVHLVDVHAAFLGHGIHCAQFWRGTYDRDDPGYWLFANLEDPNDRGYDAIRRLILRAMSRVWAEPSRHTDTSLSSRPVLRVPSR
jgi:lysophospholipase L1-like esterase